MNIFYLLIGVSLLAALIFLAAFIWAVRTGQFDDNETPAMRMLFDDESPSGNEKITVRPNPVDEKEKINEKT